MWPFNSLEPGPVSSGFYDNHALVLGTFDIRVLHLGRGSGQDDITCTLEKRLLPPTAEASAENTGERSQHPDLDCKTLSYQWGNPTRNLREIQCNGVGFRVTSNLYSALVHLRDPDSDISLWIDAICIDQKNDNEKGNQVQRMGEIFRRSECTIIWLGNGGFLSRQTFRACSMWSMGLRHPDGTARSALSAFTRSSWDPLGWFRPFLMILLLRRSYFTRIWVIQEVALSHSIEIACGDNKISWCDLTLAAIFAAFMGPKDAEGMGNILVARALLPWAARSGWTDPAWRFQRLTLRNLPQSKNLLSIAALFRRSHATDPVDKVFGLLGLCEQIQEGSTYGISPTYSRNDLYHRNRVYVSTAKTILSSQNSLHLFSAVNRRPPDNFDFFASFYRKICFRARQIPALPTWVPDWSDTGSMATPLSLILAQNNTVDTDRDAECHFGSYQLSPHYHSPHIWLLGHYVDDIIELGELCNTEKTQSSIWFSIKMFFTSSENHRLEIFGKWERQFRTHTMDEPFWENLISTVTCGSSNTYDECSIMGLLADLRSRSPRHLPILHKIAIAYCFIAPFAIAAWTGSGIVELIMKHCCLPVVVYSSIFYWHLQLVPTLMFQEGWVDHGVNNGFLEAEFDNMELRRLARLRSGSLALVPEASCIGDQIWNCKSGIVPLVLRSNGDDFEMVGECYSATATTVKRPKSTGRVIRLI